MSLFRDISNKIGWDMPMTGAPSYKKAVQIHDLLSMGNVAALQEALFYKRFMRRDSCRPIDCEVYRIIDEAVAIGKEKFDVEVNASSTINSAK